MADNPYIDLAQQDKNAASVGATPAPTDNPYTDIARQDLTQVQQQIRGVLDIVSPINPDHAGEANQLSRSSGLPVPTVQDNLEQVRRQERIRMLDLQRMMAESPVLARQLSDPNFAAIAQDSTESMSGIEKASSFLLRNAGAGFLNLGAVATKLLDTINPFTTSEEDLAVLYKDKPEKLKEALEGPEAILSRWSKKQTQMANELMKNMPDAVKREYGNKEYATTDLGNAAYTSPVKVMGDALNSLPTTLAIMVSMYLTKGAAGNTMAEAMAAGMTREQALALATKSAAETMAKYSALSEGAVGYAQQANQTRAEADKVTQAQLEKSPEYQDLVQKQGYSPEAARIYLSARTAEKAGTLAGLIDAITNFYGGRYLGKIISEEGNVAARIGKGFLTEGLVEAPQSLGEQAAQNWAMQNMNPDQSMTEGLAENFVSGFVVGGVTGGGFAGVFGRTHEAALREQEKAMESYKTFDLLNKITDMISANKVVGRDVTTFQTFMQSVADEAPTDTLYISPQELMNGLAQFGVSVEQLAQQIPALANARDNLATNTEVAIPIADFAAHMANQDYAQALLPHLKVDPNGFSKAEADEYLSTHGDKLKEEIASTLGEKVADAQFKQSKDKVKAEILDELNQTNRFTSDVNNAYAELLSSFFSVMGARLGITPSEMADRYKIKVQAEALDGQQYSHGGILKTSSEAFQNWFNGSKIVDQNGNPRVAYHGTSADFSEFKSGPRNRLVKGIYFASNPEFAGKFAGTIEGAQVMPVYLSIKNPATEADMERIFDALDYDKIRTSAQRTAILKKHGYDGVVYDTSVDGSEPIYIAFEPNQIKSVNNRGTYSTTDNNILHQSVTLREGGNETLKKYGLKPGQTYKTRDIAAALEARQRAKWGSIDPTDRSPEAMKKIAKWMMEEVLFEMAHPANSGVGWYSTKFQNALDTMGQTFPELLTDQNARDVMTALIAITSDGQKVMGNTDQAMDIYSNFRETGKFTTERGHQRQASIDGNLEVLQKLHDELGAEGMRDFLMQEKSISELKKIAKANGTELKSDYQAHINMPMAVIALGPKLGAFYANLMGAHGYLTMDRWWSRTFNRYRGTLLQAPTRPGLDRFKQLLGKPEMSDDEAIAATVAYRNSYEAKNYKNGTEIEKAANTIYKAAFENLEDAPFNAKDRTFMLDAVNQAQKFLAKKGYNLSIADIQAILWYYEKKLYGDLGARQSGKISYEEAAQKVVAARAAGLDISELESQSEGEDLGSDVETVPGDSNDYNQSTFYSGLQRAVESAKQSKAPASDWISIVRNLPGVKAEEVEWTGLKEFLELKGKEQTTKQEILDYLAANGVQVEEVMLSGQREITEEERQAEVREIAYEYGYVAEYNERSEALHDFIDQDTGDYVPWEELPDEMTSKVAKVMDETVENEDGTKYDKWQLPGGQNYRELLLTFPSPNPVKVSGTIRVKDDAQADDILTDISMGGMEHLDYGRTTDAHGFNVIEVNNVDAESWAKIEKIAYEAGSVARATSKEGSDETFQSSHWEQQNVLAHIRFNDRTDAEGNKVLFIEEMQSDWHQKGRKHGYTDQAGYEKARAHADEVAQAAGFRDAAHAAEGWKMHGIEAAKEASDLYDNLSEFKSVSGVPNAPFKDTKAWTALALKRMIAYAVEKGYEKVAFVNGEQSAERYDLRKTVGYVQYSETDPGKYYVRVVGSNGAHITTQYQQTPEQLEELIGKDLAKQITAKEGKFDEESKDYILDAKDFKMGGEGMQDFYNRIVPQVAKTVVEKLGSKVEPVELLGGNTDFNQYGERVNRNGERVSGNYKVEYPDGTSPDWFDTRAEAEEQVALNPDGVIVATDTLEQLGFAITDKMRESVQNGLPLFQGEGNRGSISFGNDITQTPSIVSLLKSADLSTFLHESGHFFLEVMADIAARPDVPADLKADMDSILKWFGVDSIETWRGMDIEQKRPYHEKFARGFEAYLFEGKAPSLELKGIFQRFRAWLVNVYKEVSKLNVELDDEIRGVFDRLVATPDAIKEAEQARSFLPMFKTKPPFMTDEEWKAYQLTDVDATNDAIDHLQARSLRDMQWLSNAKTRIIKAMQRDNNEKRKAVRAEVSAEVMAEPVYRAREFFKRGTLDGKPVDTPVKLSIAEIEAMYEGNPILGMIKKELGFGKYGILGTENGMHPQQAAELFGFSSADHLIRSLLEAPDPKTVINERTDQRMLERYGDINSPEALSKAADEAIHNEARAKFIATEANALAKAVGRPAMLAKAAKQFAADMIARLKIRDIKPGQYTSSEARAAKAAEAARAKDNLVEAATEKRNQLINNYAAKAAIEAQAEVEKGLRYFKRFLSDASRKNIDADYMDQIDALLERFDLRAGVSLKDISRRKSLLEWYNAQVEQGKTPVIDEDLLNEAKRMSYKEMTLEEFRGLVDAVRNIEHLGRLKNKLLKIQDARDFRATVDEASATIRANATKDVVQKIEGNTWIDRTGKGVKEFFAMHRKFASLIRQMDGFKDGGSLWSIFVRPMNEAANKEAGMREQATVALHELFKPIMGEKLRKKTFIPEIGTSLSLEARISIALNMGNDTNMKRIMEGEGWNMAQVNAIVGSLTREQWNFVQGVWDLINSYWPEIAAKERRVTGVVPEKVEARSFTVTLQDGTQMALQGGYYPIKYNPERSTKAEADTAAEVQKQIERGLYTRAQTARGHTKARVESVGRPMRYDFGVMMEHINQVIHDLSWHEYLIDANRLLRSNGIDSAIRDHYGPEVLKVMSKMMEDIAIGEIPAQNVFERSLNHFRVGSTIAGLGWNLMTSLLQPLGLTQSMVRIGPKWVGKGLSRWFRDAASFENSVAWISEKSEFMRLRAKTQQREINEIRNQINKGGALTAVEESFFYLIGKFQLIADVPTWLGMYEKAMANGADEAKAIALADQAVLDSQGGGQTKDLAQLQRGGVLMKLWTNFYSFFNVTYNQLAESVNETKLAGPKRLPLLAVDFLLLTALPATLQYFLKAALKGGDDKDEDKIIKELAAENLSYLFGMMIGFREVGSMLAGTMGYSGPAGTRFFADMGKFIQQAEQGEADEAFWRSVNNVGGVLLHYPAGQVDRTVRGTMALIDGETNNILAPLVGPPPKK